jgi:hypothetical protein
MTYNNISEYSNFEGMNLGLNIEGANKGKIHDLYWDNSGTNDYYRNYDTSGKMDQNYYRPDEDHIYGYRADKRLYGNERLYDNYGTEYLGYMHDQNLGNKMGFKSSANNGFHLQKSSNYILILILIFVTIVMVTVIINFTFNIIMCSKR